jgi:poly-gamma-glutamate capsule biosynthesis protein CapA/YwtB (metallophosphatase superfamily)
LVEMNQIKILVVGDISFAGRKYAQPSLKCFSKFLPVFREANLVIGNLESPLLHSGEAIPNKCTLKGNPGWADILREANVGLVSLANNHVMDYGEAGLMQTIKHLDQNQIIHLGAGTNIYEATAPRFLEINGIRLALLARSSVLVSSPTYAKDNRAGVAFFDKRETIVNIQNCKKEADVVLLLFHWGLENYHYPPYQQRQLARELLETGVDILVGHHPHVVQGIEKIDGKVVVYSLGNFQFDDVNWSFTDDAGISQQRLLQLQPKQREGLMVNFIIDEKYQIEYTTAFSRINLNGEVFYDLDENRRKEFVRLSKNLGSKFYRWWWPFYALNQEWQLRLRSQFKLKKIFLNLYKIRPSHFKELIQSLKRSSKVASGKSTDPYE